MTPHPIDDPISTREMVRLVITAFIAARDLENIRALPFENVRPQPGDAIEHRPLRQAQNVPEGGRPCPFEWCTQAVVWYPLFGHHSARWSDYDLSAD